MSAQPLARRTADPAWRATALAGLLLLGALVIALAGRSDSVRVAAVGLAVGPLPVVALVLGPAAVRRLRSAEGRSLALAVPVATVALLMLALARWDGRSSVMVMTVALLGAVAGVVLIGSELRQRTANAGRGPSARRGSG